MQDALLLAPKRLEVAHLEAELRRFDCGDVAARPGADHRDVCIDCGGNATLSSTARNPGRRRVDQSLITKLQI